MDDPGLPALEEGGDAVLSKIEELVDQDEVARPEGLAQGAHGGGGDDPADPQRSQGIDVGPVVDLVGWYRVPGAVPGQEDHLQAAELADAHGGPPVGRDHRLLAHVVQDLRIVYARSSDDGQSHGPAPPFPAPAALPAGDGILLRGLGCGLALPGRIGRPAPPLRPGARGDGAAGQGGKLAVALPLDRVHQALQGTQQHPPVHGIQVAQHPGQVGAPRLQHRVQQFPGAGKEPQPDHPAVGRIPDPLHQLLSLQPVDQVGDGAGRQVEVLAELPHGEVGMPHEHEQGIELGRRDVKLPQDGPPVVADQGGHRPQVLLGGRHHQPVALWFQTPGHGRPPSHPAAQARPGRFGPARTP